MTALKTTLIKWGGVGLAVVLIIGYAYFVRQENRALEAQITVLKATQATNLATIARMEALAKQREIVLAHWQSEQAENNHQLRKAAENVQKELLENEAFGAWAAEPVPDAVKRLFAD